MLKSNLKKITILRLVKAYMRKVSIWLSLLKIYRYDFSKFCKYSSIYSVSDLQQISNILMFDIHRIEKGLVIKNTRAGFGRDVVNNILINLDLLDKTEQKNIFIMDYGRSVLKEYHLYHQNNNLNHDFMLNKKFINQIEQSESCEAGIKSVCVSDLNLENFKTVVSTRFSCREFSDEIIDKNILKSAVELAISTPSVCNRQHWRVRCFEGEKCQQILMLQNGNKPFRNEINSVLVVTSNLNCFLTPSERYQQYIDGGMFSMSLLNALHHNKIGSCPLNWSASLEQDIAIHYQNIIPNGEAVIMVIAIGNYKEVVPATCSTRLSVDDIFIND